MLKSWCPSHTITLYFQTIAKEAQNRLLQKLFPLPYFLKLTIWKLAVILLTRVLALGVHFIPLR